MRGLFLSAYIFIFSTIFANLALYKVAEGLSKPILVIPFPNSDNKLLIIEQKGVIKIINKSKVSEKPFLDIRDRVHRPLFPGDEMGLLGFTFDPLYDKNKFCYLHYNDKNDNTIISRFKVEKYVANKSSEKIILKLLQPYSNHNGGTIAFRKDGYLYIGLGDGGSAGDPEKRAQDPSNLFGSILRINVHKGNPYSIPNSNPFITNKNFRDEIWAFGLRNPWRFSFDAITGDMIIGDVGQNLWEEINIEYYGSKGGGNYGWNIMEGTHCYPPEIVDCEKSKLILPAFEYPNNANYFKTLFGITQPNMDGCSITGGYVYRGENIKSLYGRYLFGDYCTGRIWSIKFENNKGVDLIEHTSEIMNSIGKNEFYLSSFGEDNNRELYIIDYKGIVYKGRMQRVRFI